MKGINGGKKGLFMKENEKISQKIRRETRTAWFPRNQERSEFHEGESGQLG